MQWRHVQGSTGMLYSGSARLRRHGGIGCTAGLPCGSVISFFVVQRWHCFLLTVLLGPFHSWYVLLHVTSTATAFPGSLL